MVNLFEVIVNIIEEGMILMFLTLYLGCKYRGIKMIGGYVLSVAVASETITFFNSNILFEGFLGLVFTLIFFLYCFLFLKGDIYTKMFIAGFINCMVYFTALLSNLCINILFDQLQRQLYGVTSERVALVVLSKILLVGACSVLLKFKINVIAQRRNMLILIIMPIVVEMSMVGIMQIFLEYSDSNHNLLLATVSVMLANVLTYYVFIKINKDIEIEAEMRAMQQKYESDKKYVHDVEELYRTTCEIRHDLLNHFTAINGLLTDKDSEAAQYIRDVTQNRINKIKSLVKSDNSCFNAVTSAKISVCKKMGIEVYLRIKKGALEKLSHDEIGIIFGNLFDNAIEAAKDTEEKVIELDVCMQGSRCSIVMTNSLSKSVLDDNKELKTTKENKAYHGFGVRNIQKIVYSHGGMVNYFEKNGRFGCDILI